MFWLRVSCWLLLAAVGFGGAAIHGQSLREEAERLGILIGSAARPSLFSEPLYARTLAREFNLVEPEDAMKWWVIRPNRATFDFTQGDQVVAFAETHHMKVRGHTLVWGWTNPAWLNASFTAEELSQILEEHIAKVVGHYRRRVFAWDVVNEALDEHGSVKPSLWFDQPGIGFAGKSTAYLEQAFRWAHAADPDALLFYNDSEAEVINAKSDAIYAMVKAFRHREVPIDGIGMQMHIFDLHPDFASIDANIARFTALGVQVHITEMDVALSVDKDGHASASDLAQQAEVYRRIALACLSHPGCTAIQTWGFTDKYSWIGSKFKGAKGQALLFGRGYSPKIVYQALRDALDSKPTTRPPAAPR